MSLWWPQFSVTMGAFELKVGDPLSGVVGGYAKNNGPECPKCKSRDTEAVWRDPVWDHGGEISGSQSRDAVPHQNIFCGRGGTVDTLARGASGESRGGAIPPVRTNFAGVVEWIHNSLRNCRSQDHAGANPVAGTNLSPYRIRVVHGPLKTGIGVRLSVRAPLYATGQNATLLFTQHAVLFQPRRA
jgi:hypothetical protein